MTMPGLPKVPAAEKIDVDETGKITELFKASLFFLKKLIENCLVSGRKRR